MLSALRIIINIKLYLKNIKPIDRSIKIKMIKINDYEKVFSLYE